MTSSGESTVTSNSSRRGLSIPSRRIVTWLAIWGASFAVLFQIWPRQPLHVVPRSKNLYPLRFLDSESLLVCSYDLADAGFPMYTAPLFVLHAPTGMLRRLGNSGFGQSEPQPPDGNEWDSHTDDFGGFLYGPGVVREFIAASTSAGPNDERVLHIWNWRTGQETFRHDCPSRISGVMGDITWTQPRLSPRARESLELFRIPTGERIPTAVPAEQWDFAACPKSPDGRFFVAPPERPDSVWKLDPGVVQFRIGGAFHAAFSSDSRWLATLSYQTETTHQNQISAVWRIYEVATGRVASEHVVTGRDGRHSAISFHDNDRCVVGYRGVDVDPPFGRPLRQFQEVDGWSWKEGTFRSYRASPALFSDTPESAWSREVTTPRIVVDRDSLLDLATGQRLFSKEELSRELLTFSTRWAILQDRPLRFAQWIYEQTGWVLPSLSRTERPARLFELGTGRSGPRLNNYWAGRFSPDETWLVVTDQRSLSVWQLPARPPWVRLVLTSLIVPALLFGWQLRRIWRAGRASISGTTPSP